MIKSQIKSQINVYQVGDYRLPDWFFDLVCDNVVITHKEEHERFLSRCTVQTTKEGTQVALRGDYIKQYPCGLLTVERVASVKVNASQLVVHSSLNGS